MFSPRAWIDWYRDEPATPDGKESRKEIRRPSALESGGSSSSSLLTSPADPLSAAHADSLVKPPALETIDSSEEWNAMAWTPTKAKDLPAAGDTPEEWNSAEWSPIKTPARSKAAGKKPMKSPLGTSHGPALEEEEDEEVSTGSTTHVLRMARDDLEESFGLVLSETARAVDLDEGGPAMEAGGASSARHRRPKPRAHRRTAAANPMCSSTRLRAVELLDQVISIDGEETSAGQIATQVHAKRAVELVVLRPPIAQLSQIAEDEDVREWVNWGT